MKKTIKGLVAVATLLVGCCPLWGRAAHLTTVADSDSIIVMSETELVQLLKQAAIQAKTATPSGSSTGGVTLSKEEWQLLKTQVLLNLMYPPYAPGATPRAISPMSQQGWQGDNYSTWTDPNLPQPYYGGNGYYYPPMDGNGYYPMSTYGNPMGMPFPQSNASDGNGMPAIAAALTTGNSTAAPETPIDSTIYDLRQQLRQLEAQRMLAQQAQRRHMDSLRLVVPEMRVSSPAPGVFVNEEGKRLVSYFKRQVFFRQGSAQLDLRAKNSLDEAIAILKRHENYHLYLTGYASPEGSKSFNETLTQKRAKAVYNYLTSKGIRPQQLRVVKGYIDTTPGIPTISRRVDIDVVN